MWILFSYDSNDIVTLQMIMVKLHSLQASSWNVELKFHSISHSMPVKNSAWNTIWSIWVFPIILKQKYVDSYVYTMSLLFQDKQTAN